MLDKISLYKIENQIKEAKIKSQKIAEIYNLYCSSETNKKENIEFAHLISLLIELNINFKDIKKHESPDFIIELNDSTIGVELTQLKHSKHSKEIGYLNNVVSRAERYFIEYYPDFEYQRTKHLGLTKFRAAISFNKHISLEQKDKNRNAKELATLIYNLAKNNVSNVNNIGFTTSIDIKGESKKIKFIHSPDIDNLEYLSNETINNAINKKEKKISEYKTNQKCSQYWILLIAGQPDPSSFDIDDLEVNNYKVSSEFEKVFLLDDFNKKVFVLK